MRLSITMPYQRIEMREGAEKAVSLPRRCKQKPPVGLYLFLLIHALSSLSCPTFLCAQIWIINNIRKIIRVPFTSSLIQGLCARHLCPISPGWPWSSALCKQSNISARQLSSAQKLSSFIPPRQQHPLYHHRIALPS